MLFSQARERFCPAACLVHAPPRLTEFFHEFGAQFGVGTHDENIDRNSIFKTGRG